MRGRARQTKEREDLRMRLLTTHRPQVLAQAMLRPEWVSGEAANDAMEDQDRPFGRDISLNTAWLRPPTDEMVGSTRVG